MCEQGAHRVQGIALHRLDHLDVCDTRLPRDSGMRRQATTSALPISIPAHRLTTTSIPSLRPPNPYPAVEPGGITRVNDAVRRAQKQTIRGAERNPRLSLYSGHPALRKSELTRAHQAPFSRPRGGHRPCQSLLVSSGAGLRYFADRAVERHHRPRRSRRASLFREHNRFARACA